MISDRTKEKIASYVKEIVAKRVAGDIVVSDVPGAALKKWRELFRVNRVELARAMEVAPSVISDYERGRRYPGVRFLKRFINALFYLDSLRGWPTLKQLARSLNVIPSAILDAKDLSSPFTLDELIEATEGIIVNSYVRRTQLYGYTIIDSYEAIDSLSGNEFWQLMGLTSSRALIFTGVTTGRSPMVAVRVAPIKPAVVVLQGPKKVDPIAIRLADRERIPLILSLIKDIEELINSLRKVTSHYL